MTAYAFIEHNKDTVEKVADAVLEKQEIYGDDLYRLLDSRQSLQQARDRLDEGGDVAADLTTTDARLPAPRGPAAQPPAPRLERTASRRFVFIYGTLAAVLALALAGVVVYAGRSITRPPTWSAWKPSGGGLGAAKQIAQHVGGTYHLPAGQQLVDVIAKAPFGRSVDADRYRSTTSPCAA